MSRTSLHRPRRNRAVWHRTASGTRLFTCPLSTHRSPTHLPLQALPQGPSPPPPQRSITVPPGPRDRLWKVPGQKTACPFQGPMPSARCTHPAHHPRPLGDAHEHGVKLLARAIVPRDSTLVALGEAMPHGDGRESTPPYLRMAGHFWWSRLPHTEILSRLLHVLSEARGCRRAGVDVEHPLWRTTRIGTGVAVFLRNRPGPSIPSPSSSVIPAPLLHPSGPRAGIHPLLPLNLGCRKSAYGKREPIPSHVGPTGWSPSLHHRKEPSPSDK